MKKIVVAAAVGAVAGCVSYYVGKQAKKFKAIDSCSSDSRNKSILHKPGFYEKYIKRPQDFCCALFAIIVLSPLMGIIAVFVRIKLGTPVIFKQDRPGLCGKTFTLYKFRTMTDAKDEHGELLPDEERLTEFGKMLRSTSLDELPELLNMLKGDRGIIGTTKKNIDFSSVVTA